jgi:hypothetical protein
MFIIYSPIFFQTPDLNFLNTVSNNAVDFYKNFFSSMMFPFVKTN